MDGSEKMLLENLRDDIKTLNKNVIYLCSKSSCNETRLKNIERVINDNDDRLVVCENKITKINTKIAMVAGIISVFVALAAPVIGSLV